MEVGCKKLAEEAAKILILDAIYITLGFFSI